MRPPDHPHVTAGRGTELTWRPALLHERDVVDLDGCTDVLTTVLGCLRCLPPRVALVSLDAALARGLISEEDLHLAAEGLTVNDPRRGPPAWADAKAGSPLESVARHDLLTQGRAPQTRELIEPAGFVDFLIDDWSVIEVVPRRYHSDDEQFAEDRRRDWRLGSWPAPTPGAPSGRARNGRCEDVRAPELQELRPGDLVKVRGSSNPLHQGGKAIVVAVHRSEGPPWRTVALDVRYSARGAAVRVDLGDRGELARWETPWAPAHTVEDEPHHDPAVPVAAHEAPGAVPRRRTLVAAGLVLLAAVGGLYTWEHQRPEPNPVVVQRALQEGARGTGVTNAAAPTATPTATTTTRAPYLSAVVAYGAGTVPVVAGLDGPLPTPLAGIEPAPGCRDAYVHDLLSFLPVGQQVEVTGAGWFRTDDGLDVNAELVRTGRAVPVAATAGSAAADTQNLAVLEELAAEAPDDCG